jgi:uncharacterized protein (TIGR02265 family)
MVKVLFRAGRLHGESLECAASGRCAPAAPRPFPRESLGPARTALPSACIALHTRRREIPAILWGMSDQVVFAHSVEGLFVRALGEVPPGLQERLRGIGIDLGKKLLPAYPVRVWNEVLVATAETIYPGEPLARSGRKLGERMMEGYRATLVGQAVLALAKIIGPRRALLRSRQNWRSGNNYSEVKVEELGPTDFRLTFNEASISRWVSQGLLCSGLTFAGAKETSVELESFTDDEVVYRITWK